MKFGEILVKPMGFEGPPVLALFTAWVALISYFFF